MAKCWLLLFENCAGVKGHGYLSRESISTVPGGCGVVLVYNGVNTGISERSATIYDVSSGLVAIPPEYATNYANECSPTEAKRYDCINGSCIEKTTYKTPGLYVDLSVCETSCGIGCGGKCISI
ncbi:hypothetical protein [Nostoc commune]|uniref:hypothetical protein n=1 Tax=Nostoc commune TaxID=1178 RepID=UPI0018C51DE7|nr:hypothetical protein [Nostoc commune]MBG1263092.1 hypothetical protein [Nostoc commune BAE]